MMWGTQRPATVRGQSTEGGPHGTETAARGWQDGTGRGRQLTSGLLMVLMANAVKREACGIFVDPFPM